jgi:hypothetical protein
MLPTAAPSMKNVKTPGAVPHVLASNLKTTLPVGAGAVADLPPLHAANEKSATANTASRRIVSSDREMLELTVAG